jgi:hypothetical protein
VRPSPSAERAAGALRRLRRTLAEFFYGLTGHEFARQAVELRHELETLFILATYGDMIGVPVMPPYYSLRLLPYVVPDIAVWKRRVLREREFTDEHEYHLHGV